MKLNRKLVAIISYIFVVPLLISLGICITFEFFEEVLYITEMCALLLYKPISILGNSYELDMLVRYCVLS
jgi:hypothetical protein